MKDGDIYIDFEHKAVAGVCKAKDMKKQLQELADLFKQEGEQ